LEILKNELFNDSQHVFDNLSDFVGTLFEMFRNYERVRIIWLFCKEEPINPFHILRPKLIWQKQFKHAFSTFNIKEEDFFD